MSNAHPGPSFTRDSFVQEEEFDEDEGIYDELNLEEEEEKFRMPNDESDSEESEEASEGTLGMLYSPYTESS